MPFPGPPGGMGAQPRMQIPGQLPQPPRKDSYPPGAPQVNKMGQIRQARGIYDVCLVMWVCQAGIQ